MKNVTELLSVHALLYSLASGTRVGCGLYRTLYTLPYTNKGNSGSQEVAEHVEAVSHEEGGVGEVPHHQLQQHEAPCEAHHRHQSAHRTTHPVHSRLIVPDKISVDEQRPPGPHSCMRELQYVPNKLPLFSAQRLIMRHPVPQHVNMRLLYHTS